MLEEVKLRLRPGNPLQLLERQDMETAQALADIENKCNHVWRKNMLTRYHFHCFAREDPRLVEVPACLRSKQLEHRSQLLPNLILVIQMGNH